MTETVTHPSDDRQIIEWWAANYWRQIRRLHKAYANLGCVDEFGSAMHYTGEVGEKDCTCSFCASNSHSSSGTVGGIETCPPQPRDLKHTGRPRKTT